MPKHLRHWGAVYILAVLFLGSWIGQAFAMAEEIRTGGWTVFWASTLENWQSEWFQADAKDLERIEAKIDSLRNPDLES